jgi:anti-sigma factor RsiW
MTADGHGTATEHLGDELSAALDYELEPVEATRVERHLDGCADCRAELAGLERARRTIRELGPVEAPPGLVDGIIRRRQGATRRAAALVGVAASLLVGLSLVAVEPPPAERPVAAPEPTLVRSDSGFVRLESTPRRDRDEDQTEPSLADRAHDAGQELLEFLTG